MRKTIIALAVALAFTAQGCVPFAVWVTQNKVAVEGVALIGGAVYAVENDIVGAFNVKEKITPTKPESTVPKP